MEEKNIEAVISASENTDAILLLSNLTESAVENDLIKKPWDLYPLFKVIKILCKDSLDGLRRIQD